MGRLQLNKKPSASRPALKVKSNKTRDELNSEKIRVILLHQLKAHDEKEKKLKPAPLNEWISISSRLPPNSMEKIIIKYSKQRNSQTELIPAQNALQHILLDIYWNSIKPNIIEWFRFPQ